MLRKKKKARCCCVFVQCGVPRMSASEEEKQEEKQKGTRLIECEKNE